MHPLQEPQVNLDHIRKIHDLPIEILDMIFDFLRPSNWDSIAPSGVHQHPRGTHNDLAACHAVSRLWREHTRKHFFRDFTIIFRAKNRPPQMFTGPMAATLRELHSRSQLPELPAFYPSLEGHPFIARCIRRLRLHGEIVPKDCACLCDSAAKYIPKIEPALLLGILRSIPNLRVLHLSNVVLTALPASRLETPLSCLQISYTCASHFGRHLRMPDLEITQVLNCFARVNELSLLGRGLSPKDPADVRHYHGPSGLQVKKFVLQRRWNRGVLFKHLAHASLENVRCLVLQGVSLLGDIDLELFPAFLCTIGPRLEEFRIYLTHDHHHGISLAFDTQYDVLTNIFSWCSGCRCYTLLQPQGTYHRLHTPHLRSGAVPACAGRRGQYFVSCQPLSKRIPVAARDRP